MIKNNKIKQSVLLIPTHSGVGLISVTIGIVRKLEAKGYKVAIFNPIKFNDISELSDGLVASYTTSINFEQAEKCILDNKIDELLDNILEQYEQCLAQEDIVIIKGVLARKNPEIAAFLNKKLADSLGCNIILVTAPYSNSQDELKELIEYQVNNYGGVYNKKIQGIIVNQLGSTSLYSNNITSNINTEASSEQVFPSIICNNIIKDDIKKFSIFNNIDLIAAIDWDINLVAPRVYDIIKILGAKVILEGNLKQNRVKQVKIFARTVNNIIPSLKPGTLIVTAGDRIDILIAVCYAVVSGVNIPALILTGKNYLDKKILEFCEPAAQAGLNIISLPQDSFQTAMMLHNIRIPPPNDDKERVEYTKNYISEYISDKWLDKFVVQKLERKLTPAAFKYLLIDKARKSNKTIVLPEGNELRTITAANICAHKNIATCILLGDQEEIINISKKQGITLHKNIKILEPELLAPKYINKLVELRKHKGMTEILAKEQLKDNVMLGTMMLQMGEVDGLVAGALNTTAHTVRPALQIIKTKQNLNKNSGIVSSIFFMCMPEQVLVFGDCAINPEPSAEQLAQIAIDSANSARYLGIEPRVAMLSYSTGISGSGSDVDKVKKATELVKHQEPNLLVDGPLQYDAAVIPSVAQSKAPGSKVAGIANVLIFPDLNTGNTTYKAVQRSANVLSIGPMLQGLNKPVNDLSRGATVDDIVYTIAITVIQSDIT